MCTKRLRIAEQLLERSSNIAQWCHGLMGVLAVFTRGCLVGDLPVDGMGQTRALKAAELIYLCISLGAEYS